MLVLGGQDVTGSDLISFEVYDDKAKSWRAIPEWEMAQGRYRLFQIFIQMTSILIQRLGYNGSQGCHGTRRPKFLTMPLWYLLRFISFTESNFEKLLPF